MAYLLHEKWAASHQKDKVNKALRYAKIGAAALGGGALLALTGGLAAPAISVGLAAMGTTAGAMVARYVRVCVGSGVHARVPSIRTNAQSA